MNKTLILVTLALISINLGCKLEDEDPSRPLVTSEDDAISKALRPELNKIDITRSKVGDLVHYQWNYRLENSEEVNILGSLKRQLTQSQWQQSPNYMVFNETQYFYKNNVITDSVQRDIEWNFSNDGLSALFKPFDLSMQNLDDTPSQFVIYNVKSERQSIVPAKSIQNRPGCGGVESCRFNGVYLNYLIHELKNGTVVQKYDYSVFVSAQVPAFFAFDPRSTAFLPMVYECYSYVEQNTYVRRCQSLVDLDKQP